MSDRTAYDLLRRDRQNLTEKVIPNLRDEIERLRKERDEAKRLLRECEPDIPCGGLRSTVRTFLAGKGESHE